ncbi:MAG TPA: DUF432 domain-containing protein [Methanocorpusculum sp.]|nr:DUF432 domain-containing protein [Methanocorpusculum sp.]
MKPNQDMYHYHRELGRWKRDINVCVREGHMLFHPIEPLFLPEIVTDYLEIQFDEVMIEPHSISVFFLTFPLEIGVFVQASGVTKILDVVSFNTPKYSLYGSVNRGVITRWYKSGVFLSPPHVQNYQEGILRLKIENTTDDWVNVSRVIIHEKGMHVYFDEHCVSMAAEMIISFGGTAAVTGVSLPLYKDMTHSVRMYESRGSTPFFHTSISLIDSTFIMDAGLT